MQSTMTIKQRPELLILLQSGGEVSVYNDYWKFNVVVSLGAQGQLKSLICQQVDVAATIVEDERIEFQGVLREFDERLYRPATKKECIYLGPKVVDFKISFDLSERFKCPCSLCSRIEEGLVEDLKEDQPIIVDAVKLLPKELQ